MCRVSIVGFNSRSRSPSSRTDACRLILYVKLAYAIAEDLQDTRLNCTVTRWRSHHRPSDRLEDTCYKLPAALRCSNWLLMTRSKSQGNSTTPKPYASRVLSKEFASYIEKVVGWETKREKKKEQTKTEDGIVGRLAKNSLIDKDKVGDII